jgi:hypothetical protein
MRARSTAETNDPPERAPSLQSGGLYASLAVVLIAGMVSCSGIGRLFVREDGDTVAWGLALGGGAVALLAGLLALRILNRLPSAKDDCTRYGRHIVGLTFVLLVAGLWNAAITSTLALEGDLGLSAETFIEATDSEHMKAARTARADAVALEKQAERDVRDAERRHERAIASARSACAKPAADGAAEPGCIEARKALELGEDDVQGQRDTLFDAQELRAAKDKECDESRRILFFLLSMSTLMALFGAAFYVVNRVRTKRPHFVPDGTGGAAEGDIQPGELVADAATATVTATVTNGSSPPPPPVARGNGAELKAPAALPAPTTLKATLSTPLRKPTEEPFDTHAFWSGAFFRIGEAVLFTFAFFWLIWTSASTELLVWLPVLALFVGMFVKTGETIVFRLGLRILSATEAFLPAGPGALRVDASAPHESAPDGAARASDAERAKKAASEARPSWPAPS